MIAYHDTAVNDGKYAIRQFRNEWRMADEDHLVESTKIHSPAQHAHVLLAIDRIQSSHGFVPEKSFVKYAFALPHVVDGNAQVDGFVDQYELPA